MPLQTFTVWRRLIIDMCRLCSFSSTGTFGDEISPSLAIVVSSYATLLACPYILYTLFIFWECRTPCRMWSASYFFKVRGSVCRSVSILCQHATVTSNYSQFSCFHHFVCREIASQAFASTHVAVSPTTMLCCWCFLDTSPVKRTHSAAANLTCRFPCLAGMKPSGAVDSTTHTHNLHAINVAGCLWLEFCMQLAWLFCRCYM